MDIHLCYALRSVIGQLRTSSHQLEIEVGKYTRIPLEERICQCVIKHWNPKNTMFVTVVSFMKSEGDTIASLNKAFGPPHKVIEYEDQQCLGLFLLDLKRHREKLLKNTATQPHPQRTIITFFSPITPTNATSQSRDTQMGSQPGHNKGVTSDQAIAICRARRPRPHGLKFSK